jgi:hypothetical protein
MESAAASLPTLVLHDDVDRDSIDPRSITKAWLENLQQKISQDQLKDVSELFIDESWWRDIVGLSWNITTKRGANDISQYLQSQAAKSGFGHFNVIDQGALQPRLSDMGGLIWIESGFTFDTKSGTGRGIVRLANVSALQWKAWIVHTNLDELKGFPEQPPQDILNEDKTKDAQVLIIGAGMSLGCSCRTVAFGANPYTGQSGLALAARLKALNIATLIVDKSPQIGGGWPQRYDVSMSCQPLF